MYAGQDILVNASSDRGSQNQMVGSPPKYEHLAENWGPIFRRTSQNTQVIPGMNHNLSWSLIQSSRQSPSQKKPGVSENRNPRMTLDLFSSDNVDSPARKQPTLEHFRSCPSVVSWARFVVQFTPGNATKPGAWKWFCALRVSCVVQTVATEMRHTEQRPVLLGSAGSRSWSTHWNTYSHWMPRHVASYHYIYYIVCYISILYWCIPIHTTEWPQTL